MMKLKENGSHLIDNLKRISYILILFIFIASCTSRTIYKKPDNLISKDEMVQLWTDIMIANGARTVKNTMAQGKINYMPFINKKYNIDSTRFMNSNIYYTSNIEEYEAMFQEVLLKLKKIKATYDPSFEDIDENLPIWKQDSIRNSRKLKKPKKVNTQIDSKLKEKINKE